MKPLPSPRPACPASPRRTRRQWAGLGVLALCCGSWGTAQADPASPPAPLADKLPQALATEIASMVKAAAAIVWGDAARPPRIEVTVGELDSRLKLAACQQIVPYLPAGTRPIGRTRIGLRCAQGTARWNVSLPVTVMVWAQGLTATTSLPAGTVLAPQHLVLAEIDLAARADPALTAPASALGRTLARGLAPGEALRRDDLKARQWFNAGDTVRVLAQGPGYAVSSEGQALNAGIEGQSVRVRTEGGRVVTGLASGDRRVDVAL